ncbi:hypothetical protein [Desulfobacula sp.]|uniref:hypothetical protein n=1 Tax=Desulfobacula sp. TaxID=2593537 RepID=UPI001EB969BB|nr:hypothetical protein [Desulfobacula sp.]
MKKYKNFYPSGKIIFIVLTLNLVMATSAFSSETALGMITQVSGRVSYIHKDKKQNEPPESFMNFYKGDKIILEPDSLLQLIFFENGRKETWEGPASFYLDHLKGVAIDHKGAAPKITSLPAIVTNEVRRTSKIVNISRLQTSGAVIVRGQENKNDPAQSIPPVQLDVSEEREIDLAKNTYKMLLKNSSKTDITPELYLFSVLADYDQFREMSGLIETMNQKQPDNSTIQELSRWLESQM